MKSQSPYRESVEANLDDVYPSIHFHNYDLSKHWCAYAYLMQMLFIGMCTKPFSSPSSSEAIASNVLSQIHMISSHDNCFCDEKYIY